MSATLRKPLIVVKKAWKEDAPKQELVEYVAVTGGKDLKKVVNFIPIDDGSRGVEHLVGHTIKQFKRHAKEAVPEDDLFQEFTKCLDGVTLHMWELIKVDKFPLETDETKKNFEKALSLLTDEVCGHNDMRDTQIYWMSHGMRKPKGMSPREFYFRFKEIYDISMSLNGKFQKPNDHEKKTMLFNAFPNIYKEKFQESAKTIEDSTAETIVNYFQTLHDFEESKGQLLAESTKREREEEDESPRKRPRNRGRQNESRDERNENRSDRTK